MNIEEELTRKFIFFDESYIDVLKNKLNQCKYEYDENELIKIITFLLKDEVLKKEFENYEEGFILKSLSFILYYIDNDYENCINDIAIMNDINNLIVSSIDSRMSELLNTTRSFDYEKNIQMGNEIENGSEYYNVKKLIVKTVISKYPNILEDKKLSEFYLKYFDDLNRFSSNEYRRLSKERNKKDLSIYKGYKDPIIDVQKHKLRGKLNNLSRKYKA